MNTAINTIKNYWDNYSTEFDDAHNTEDIGLWKKELIHLTGMEKRGILDVGTGTGFLAIMMSELGHDVSGIDVSEEMLKIAAHKAKQKNLDIFFVQGTCEKMPFSDNLFDDVVNCRVLWTLTEPVKAVREWMRVLKPGGKVISFMRVMDVDTTIYETDGEGIELPLKNATREDYLSVYREAGLKDLYLEDLPKELSHAEDMAGWTVFCGTK